MYEFISNIDYIIRELSEVKYYKRLDDHDKFKEHICLILENVNRLRDKIKTFGNVELAEKLSEEIDENYILDRTFQSNMVLLKKYILNNYQINNYIYKDENLKIIRQKDNALYHEIINRKSDEYAEKRQYNIEWNRIYDISMSICDENGKKTNICSFGNPWQEALLYADSIDKMTEKCIVFGFGLGYHIQEMINLYPDMEIYVLENDLEQIRNAVYYRNIEDILLNDNVHVIYCKDATVYAKWLGCNIELNEKVNIECKMWMPSVKAIGDKDLRQVLERYNVSFYSMDYFKKKLDENFRENQLLRDENVSVIRSDIEGKDVILIAAGPSLDKQIDNLKKLLISDEREHICILCVGKICRKLLQDEIRPDYIIMTDANETTKWQTDGLEKSGIPLIYLSTVAANVSCQYFGKRYIAYQEGFDKSEDAARCGGYLLFETGGSVATFAIDLALKLGCRRLICVGLDMGYIGNRTHADKVGGVLADKDGLKQVEAVGGGNVYTSKNLESYRLWIEKRISREKSDIIINASNGARIHGMIERDLCEIYDLK